MELNYILGDAFKSLGDYKGRADLIITSYPDFAEIGMEKPAEYIEFLTKCASLLNDLIKANGFIALVLSDRRMKGCVLMKHVYALDTISREGFVLKDYKILVKDRVERINLYRPNFSHIMIFSKYGKISIHKRKGEYLRDVIVYPVHGQDQFSVRFVAYLVRYLSKPGDLVVDPFAGRGTVLYTASRLNRNAVGCEISPDIYNNEFKFEEDPKTIQMRLF